MVLVGFNLESDRLGRKGIITVENRRLTSDEVNKIALIAPKATLNIIDNFHVVEKKQVELPECIERVVKCINPRCVTNKEDIETRFAVVEEVPPTLRCDYCERVMEPSEIILK
jgi:aspartate carbamoyltransferase regulatory subunit